MKHFRQIMWLGLVVNNGVLSAELFDNVKIEPSGRYRYQEVQDPVRGDAQASTLKLRLSVDWRLSDNWQTFAEFDYVHGFNESGYNSVVIQRATSPIPDPPGQELNQLFIRYVSDRNWLATLGRQALTFDNERHIGRVEFWQNDQTFDALSLHYQDHLQWTASYVYVDKVQRIFGNDADPILSPADIRYATDPRRPATELGEHDHDSHLLNVRYALNRQLRLTLYGYMLNNQSANILSSDTWGMRIEGSLKPDKIKYGYTVDYAHQADSNNNPWHYDVDYWLLEGSVQFKSHELALTVERFAQDNGFGFTTSLATNHKFQGWADVFNSYRLGGGLLDMYMGYKGRDSKLRWQIVAHQFSDPQGERSVGHELDVEVAYRFDRQWEFKFIGAKYFADQGFDNFPASQQDLSTWMVSAAYNL